MAKKKGKKRDLTPKQTAYKDQWKRLQERVKKLEKQGYSVDVTKLPREKRATTKAIEELREYNLKKVRKFSTREVDGTTITAEAEFKEEQRRKREEKRRQKEAEEKAKQNVEDDYSETYEWVSLEPEIEEPEVEEPKPSYDEDREDYEDILPSEAESLLDGLYELLDPDYYEKDKKHKSSFTDQAVENMGTIRELLDDIYASIESGNIELYNTIAKNYNTLRDLIESYTRDYKAVTFYPDFILFSIYELTGNTLGSTGTTSATSETYNYHNSSDDE